MLFSLRADAAQARAFLPDLLYLCIAGNLNVPLTYRTEDGKYLGRWISTQRANGVRLSEEKRKLLESLIKKEQIANPIYIEVNDDNSGVIAVAIRKAFSNLGFVVTGNSSNAAYIAKAEVNYNQASGTSKIVYNPYMTLSLNGKAGSIYAFSTESEKVVAPNEAAAKKIAASDLAESINQKLESDIKTTLALN